MSYPSDQSDDSMISSPEFVDEYSEPEEEDKSNHISEEDKMYTIITNIFADILAKNPLINTGSIIARMASRADAIDDLHYEICNNESLKACNFNNIMIDDLNDAIIGTARFIEKMDDKYESLECSVDTCSPRRLIRSVFEMGSRDFERGFHEYLWAAERNLVKVFNDYISRDYWMEFNSQDYDNERPLPFVDKLRITL